MKNFKVFPWADNFKMFTSSKNEIEEMFKDNSSFRFAYDKICIQDYLFIPSKAYKTKNISAISISSIDIESMTIRVENELIFFPVLHKEALKSFGEQNNIKFINRPDLWSWILEPFLDTEYTQETDQRRTTLLSKYGLTYERVYQLRAEISNQMLKYNFDSMLWD